MKELIPHTFLLPEHRLEVQGRERRKKKGPFLFLPVPSRFGHPSFPLSLPSTYFFLFLFCCQVSLLFPPSLPDNARLGCS